MLQHFIQWWTSMISKDHSTDNRTLQADIVDRVKKIRSGLKSIGSLSEKEFMALGASLMEGSTAGKTIESKALIIVSMAEGSEEKKALRSMKDLIDNSLSRFRHNSENIRIQFESVKSVLRFLDELQGKNEDIERLARYLRAVALNIFIETSRSSFVSENFSIIAKEIKQLSENIVDLSKNVNATVDDSKKRFSGLLAGIMDGVDELGKVSGVADSAVKKAVDITDSWLDSAERTAVNAANMGKNLASHVEKIVVSLQFHDAMRQRLEHVVTGFSDIADLFENALPGKERLATAHAMSTILYDQLHHMTDEIAEVHIQVSAAFDTLGHGIATIAEQVISLTGNADQDSGSQGSDVGRHLLDSIQGLGSLRNRGTQLLDRMNDIYGSALSTTSVLTELTGKIHDISMDAHVKGINAIIAASHLGEEGRTLAVLAGEMKRLADMAELFVKDVAVIIQKVVNAMSRNDGEEGGGLEQEHILDSTLSSIVSMVDRMKNQAGDLNRNMETMNSVHQKVKIQLQIIPAMAGNLKMQMDSLKDLVNVLSPYADRTVQEKMLDNPLFNRYTMEKERRIHRTIASAGRHNAESDVQTKEDTHIESREFGDNIELF